MRELLRTGDPLRIARLTALLEDQNIRTFVFDSQLNAMFPGMGDLFRARLMVSDEDYRQARRILAELGEALPDE